MLAGHQTAPGRSTHRRPGEEIRKPHPLGRHAIEVRRLDVRSAIEARFVVPEFVGHDVNTFGRASTANDPRVVKTEKDKINQIRNQGRVASESWLAVRDTLTEQLFRVVSSGSTRRDGVLQ